MKILFLDDSKYRQTKFHRNSFGHSVDFAFSAQEAVDFLKVNSYDLLYLDHDLEGSHYEYNWDKDKDGRYVSRCLVKMTKHHGKIVFIHSLNHSKRKEMRKILSDKFDVYTSENFGANAFPCLWEIPVSTILEMTRKLRLCRQLK